MTNLDEALRSLSLNSHLETLLWAAAICVNQQDQAERSSQILLMRRLYQNAESVSAWLGPYPDHDDNL
jgi:hypothetical protein